jgi:hypothetical protein
MLKVVADEAAHEDLAAGLDEIVREGARRMRARPSWHVAPPRRECAAQPAARWALAEIRDTRDRAYAEKAIKDFADAYGAKYPKALAKITEDQEQLLAFFDFPAEHWVHLKMSNRSRVHLRHSQAANRGPGSRAAGLAIVFKLIEAASERWRYVNGPHLVALVRAGVKLEKGVLAERPHEAEMKDAA